MAAPEVARATAPFMRVEWSLCRQASATLADTWDSCFQPLASARSPADVATS